MFGISLDTFLDVVAIVRAVVSGLESERKFASLVSLIEQCGELSHSKDSIETALEVSFIIRISFLGDGESDHLQARSLEYLHESSPVVSKLLVRLQAFRHGCNHLFLYSAVGLQANEK